ncbi:MAG: glycosyltransferase family 4 protein [Anaerolineae bacterium]|nr:MAG: glycosyltransferase family 4 protein [Anaerolineae bacterium]
MKILFLSSWFPYPANNGSKIRINNLLQALADHHEVTLLSFTERPNGSKDVPELQALCQEIQTVPWKPYKPDTHRARWGFLSLTPRSLLDTFSEEMRQLIESQLSNGNYNLVIASELGMASYSQYFHDVPALFEDVELSLFIEPFSHATSKRSRVRNGLTWGKLHYYLNRLVRNFKAFTVVSKKEHQLLARFVNTNQTVEIVPNCIDLKNYQEFGKERERANSIIYTGSFGYAANYDAMTWFLKEIYPDVLERFPDANLMITGDHENLPLPNTEAVTLTGFVDDVRPLVAGSCISVAPLRAGGGTRIKILEAMALGTPVVATTKGAEGLDVQHGRHLLIADTPAAFSASISRLLTDPPLRQKLAINAYQLVKESYDWAGTLPDFLHLIERVAAAK